MSSIPTTTDGVVVRKQNIFEIGEELEQIFDAFDHLPSDEADEEIRKALEAYFEKVGEDLNNKIDGYCGLIKTMEARAKIRAEEAKRLKSLAETDENNAKRLKKRLNDFMSVTSNTKMETRRFKVWVQNNGGATPIEWTGGEEPDPETLPPAYVIIKKELDLEAIRSDLEGEIPLDFAKLGERGTHVRIK
ncbi:MAG: hypothetical protein BGO01_20745 [Armatimonadetes bacterium 55-13]|nr:siphovirus Gp157 family protein [Armatimonadota bacterium]OJU64541.1 MAG: hypothetical protein BGO01_20745 [Armatimonadetes bacterium 55-13]